MPNTEFDLNIANVPIDFFLVSVLQSKLSNSEFIVKTNLNPDALRILNLVLSKCPDIINSIGAHIKTIISDDVVNSLDIPEVILLVRDVLNINVSELNKLKITREEVIILVKNIFVILIESDEIKTTPESKEVCLTLLDISIRLLESKVNVQKVIRCNFFKK